MADPAAPPLSVEDLIEELSLVRYWDANESIFPESAVRALLSRLLGQQTEREQLWTALEGLAINGVTAGASPQRNGGMMPPLWHMHCKLCGEQWHGTQWKQPRTHPAADCLLAPPAPSGGPA